MEQECFFCKLYEKELREIIVENKSFFCVNDENPVSRGHVMLVAKNHIASFFNLNDQQQSDYYNLLVEAQKVLEKEYSPDGYNIGINEGEAAGQTQNHLHIHVIPRYKGDIDNPRGGVRGVIPRNMNY